MLRITIFWISLAYFSPLRGCEALAWEDLVYNERHFHDLAFDSTLIGESVTRQATLLIKFTEECYHHLQSEDIYPEKLAPSERLTIAYYDEKVHADAENKWFVNSEMGDVKSLFPVKHDCLAAMFVSPKKPMTDAMFWEYKSAQRFAEWFWNIAKIQISISNQYRGLIQVQFKGKGPAVEYQTLAKGESVDLSTYVGYYVTFSDLESNKIFLWILLDWSDAGREITLDETHGKELTEEQYLTNINLEHAAFIEEQTRKKTRLSTMYIQIFKQPMMVFHFNADGYTALRLPTVLHDALIQYKNKPDADSEASGDAGCLEPIVNTDDVSVRFLKLSKRLKDALIPVVEETVREWLSVAPEVITVSDVYVYGRGSYIRHHVTRIEKHLTAAIVVDSTGADGVIYDVLNYAGLRESVRVALGDMIVYESASLVHGWNEPFRGDTLSMVYINIKLTEPWHWHSNEDNTAAVAEIGKMKAKEQFTSFRLGLKFKERKPQLIPKKKIKTLLKHT